MNIEYKNDICSNYMVIKDEDRFSIKDYPIKIMLNNRIEGLLKFDYEMINGQANCVYDISSKQPLYKVFENKKMDFEDLKHLIFSMDCLIKNMREYLMDMNDLIMGKEYIYRDINTLKYEYCCYPYYGGNLASGLQELFASLLAMIDYKDTRAVRLAYDMQRQSMEENFTIEDIVKIFGQISQEKPIPDFASDGPEYEKNYCLTDSTDIYGNYSANKPEGTYSYVNKSKAFENRKEEVFFDGNNLPKKGRAYVNERKNTGENENNPKTFFQKASIYFKEKSPSEVFDDFNELKIFRKINEVGKHNGASQAPASAASLHNNKQKIAESYMKQTEYLADAYAKYPDCQKKSTGSYTKNPDYPDKTEDIDKPIEIINIQNSFTEGKIYYED